MKNKALAVESGPGFFLLLVFVFWMVHPLGAGAKAGAQLKIVTKDGTQSQGELLAVKGNTLLIQGSDYEKSISFDLDEIRDLVMVGKSNALMGSGIGLVLGSFIGGVLPVDEKSWFPGIDRAVHVCTGAGIGLLLGLVSGSFVHQEEPLIVASVYQVEPGKLLKKLRSVAKDPEYR
jgi:hypothetical protein